LNNCESGERSRILRLIKRKNKNQAKVKELVDLVVSRGGLEYAAQQMNEFRSKALAGILEFPESESRTALIELVNYTTTRNK
jgi:octaprenyl-diphosphate synthase